MSRRRQSAVLAVDANILVSAVFGRAGAAVVAAVGTARALVTSAEVEREARRRVSDPRFRHPRNDVVLAVLFQRVRALPASDDLALLPEAARALSRAPASANGGGADAHLLAAAWATHADIWTHGRDFAGRGWPTWSTRNLRAALAARDAAGGPGR